MMKARKRALLEGLKLTGTVGKPTEIAGVSRATHYRWLTKDASYRRKVEEVESNLAASVLGTLRIRAEVAMAARAGALAESARRRWAARALANAVRRSLGN